MADAGPKKSDKILTDVDLKIVRDGEVPKAVGGVTRRNFLLYTIGAVAGGMFLGTVNTGCSGGSGRYTDPPVTYPIASDIFTTRRRVIVVDSVPGANPVFPWEISKFVQNGYGTWHYESGVDYGKQTNIMPAGYSGAGVTNTAQLLNFFTITDIHITDKESPAQLIYLAVKDYSVAPDPSLYSPVMLYTTHVLDAAIQTVNALHRQNAFDCGISLGDAANDSQYNELRWYIDVMDGKVITPSSGGNAGADTIDYQKPYKAAGLDESIPWYQTIGNHDHLWLYEPGNSYLQQAYTGANMLQLGDLFLDPNAINERTYYMGTLDGSTPYGNIIGTGPVSSTSPITIAADPNRRSVWGTRNRWMSEFLTTSSNPAGHGFTQTNVDNDFACYSFEPKSNMPLKIIMLDNTQNDKDHVSGNAHGSLDQPRYEWLVSELDQGQTAGQLMIIAAHIPIGVAAPGSFCSWSPDAYVTEAQLIAKLQTYSNLILWISGHRHYSQITPFNSPDPSQPERGFWEVETASLRDFPQQFRTFQIVRNSDNTVSIIITCVDPAVADGSPASISRSYGVAAQQIYNTTLLPSNPSHVYNAELIKQLSPAMQMKIQSYGTPIPR
jgi:metallophosphoesterase (TIGR03768 family)